MYHQSEDTVPEADEGPHHSHELVPSGICSIRLSCQGLNEELH